jgi:hypothetical protein
MSLREASHLVVVGLLPVPANVMFLFAYALAFVAAYLLARELGVGRAAAVVAGVAFPYAPYRLEHDGQLNILSSGGIPLALFLGLRGLPAPEPEAGDRGVADGRVAGDAVFQHGLAVRVFDGSHRGDRRRLVDQATMVT